MKTKLWAVALVIFTTLINTAAQVVYKFAAGRLEFDMIALITNYLLFVGLGLYIISGFLLIIALKGGELSVLYPIVALSYIWVIFASKSIFNESISLLKWAGVVIIVLGVSAVGIGGRK